MKDYSVTGKKVSKLIQVTDQNNNKYYHMFELGDGTFKVSYGRIEGTETTFIYPMHQWNKKYAEKLKKGYKDVTHLFVEEVVTAIDEAAGNVSKLKSITNSIVKQLIDELQAYANKTVVENYSIAKDLVTQKQVDNAQIIINNIVSLLKSKSDKDTINKSLIELYTIIPRRMKKVQDYLLSGVSTSDELNSAYKLIEHEQELLDTMAGQVKLIQQQKESLTKETNQSQDETDILKILGLEIDEASSSDIDKIKKLLGANANQFRKAFVVKNNKTESAFNDYINKSKHKGVQLLWHGSRNENIFNIIQTGLLIRPSGAVYTGSMFGLACYFATVAQKSIGYTSLRGSYWARGGSNKAYLILYNVHTGNMKQIYKHTSACYDLNYNDITNEGFDSVFAHKGADLRNDEIMIYNTAQCTIKYLIEISQ